MKFDFDKPIDRKGTESIKWNVGEGELPMWIADMDFEVAPAIKKAIIDRAEHGVYAYTDLPDEWYDAYIGWWGRRHGLDIAKDELIFCTGVVPAISSIVRRLTLPAEKVVLLTPVYNIFFNSIVNNGAYVLESPLKYEDDEYFIDFEELERKLSDPQASLMILCNPHNPIGKIWDKETLSRIGELCHKYGVTVISDEIHCDLCDPGYKYVPFASVSELCRSISITCVAPSKTFNVAGIHTSAVIVSDPRLRHKVWRGLNTDEIAEPNVFAARVAIAALTEGEEWLGELCEYIKGNKDLVRNYVYENELPIKVVNYSATYLIWLDCSAFCDDCDDFCGFAREHTGLYLCAGAQYGECGKKFVRMNLATQRSRVQDGMERLKRAVELYIVRK